MKISDSVMAGIKIVVKKLKLILYISSMLYLKKIT